MRSRTPDEPIASFAGACGTIRVITPKSVPGQRAGTNGANAGNGTICFAEFMSAHSPAELQRIYGSRFSSNLEYRRRVWEVLVAEWFGQYVRRDDLVLDLGCGYGEFINGVQCGKKLAMDLNPDARAFLRDEVTLLPQDCSAPWLLEDGSLDVIFTSNFLEHLPDKTALARTLDEAARCLRPGGRFIAMGPNVKYLPGAYWDFWDHYVPLTEASLAEALRLRGFRIDVCIGRFLPYTMVTGPRYPMGLLRLYLRLPLAWRLFGKQFLIVATRT
jgi:SAM-dependent methyltransferase